MTFATPRRTRWRGITRLSTRHQLLLFVGVALFVVVAVSAGTVLASERLARRHALDDAEQATLQIADVLIAPLIEGHLAGPPQAQSPFEQVVANRLRDETLHSLVVWAADGRILFSTIEGLEGGKSEPSDELLRALAGDVVAEVDPEPEQETAYRTPSGPLLEVYALIPRVASPLVLEAYFDHAVIERDTARLRAEILPVTLGGLLVLQLVQIPIAASLAARVRRRDVERASLGERNLAESERERRIIAADLHDGPVQDLAGVSYALSGLRNAVAPDRHAAVDRLIDATRRAVAGLRQVMIDVYPPDLSGDGLPTALRSLCDRLRDAGLEVDLVTGPLPPLGPDQAAALYRAAKESLANVVHHAEAAHVWVRLVALDGGSPGVRLEVADDGVGFPPDRIGQSPDGHLGLQLMADRLRGLGAEVRFGNRPEGGAMVTAELPADREE